jgi:hypothetical protein
MYITVCMSVCVCVCVCVSCGRGMCCKAPLLQLLSMRLFIDLSTSDDELFVETNAMLPVPALLSTVNFAMMLKTKVQCQLGTQESFSNLMILRRLANGLSMS